MKKLFFLFYAIFIFGCNTDGILNFNKIDISELKKQWVHSREEETDSIQIYRPVNYKDFPPSRYRQVYSFSDSARCEYLVLAPNNGHYFENGTWAYNEDNQILVIFNSSQQIIRKFKVVLLAIDILKFVQIK